MSKNVLREVLEGFNGKYVMVNVKSAIAIPYLIPKFQFISDNFLIMFDDEENEIFQFQIYYDTIKWIEYDEDLNIISFEIEDGGFRTILEVMMCE
jgi:hypothetical protein